MRNKQPSNREHHSNKSAKMHTSTNKSFDRIDRIGDLMHRAISKILREEFKDPRVDWVTVASVVVSRDLAHAKVYITILDESKIKITLDILNKASGFFRGQLARLMSLRIVPKPFFIYDESIARGSRILSLLESDMQQNKSTTTEIENEAENENKTDNENENESNNSEITNQDDDE